MKKLVLISLLFTFFMSGCSYKHRTITKYNDEVVKIGKKPILQTPAKPLGYKITMINTEFFVPGIITELMPKNKNVLGIAIYNSTNEDIILLPDESKIIIINKEKEVIENLRIIDNIIDNITGKYLDEKDKYGYKIENKNKIIIAANADFKKEQKKIAILPQSLMTNEIGSIGFIKNERRKTYDYFFPDDFIIQLTYIHNNEKKTDNIKIENLLFKY